eukprot:5227867-Amphidinium_carterae.7
MLFSYTRGGGYSYEHILKEGTWSRRSATSKRRTKSIPFNRRIRDQNRGITEDDSISQLARMRISCPYREQLC